MQITMIGLDIAKNVFQVHGIDANEKIVIRKQLRRSKVMAFSTPCHRAFRPLELDGEDLVSSLASRRT
jgi:hypothetical protein